MFAGRSQRTKVIMCGAKEFCVSMHACSVQGTSCSGHRDSGLPHDHFIRWASVKASLLKASCHATGNFLLVACVVVSELLLQPIPHARRKEKERGGERVRREKREEEREGGGQIGGGEGFKREKEKKRRKEEKKRTIQTKRGFLRFATPLATTKWRRQQT